MLLHLKVYKEIEELLLDITISPEKKSETTLITENYSVHTGNTDAPLLQIKDTEFLKESICLKHTMKEIFRVNMGDQIFNNLAMMEWHKDILKRTLNLVQVGNEYIEDCEDSSHTKYYENRFTKESDVTKPHLFCEIDYIIVK